jgi:hypothetical protein
MFFGCGIALGLGKPKNNTMDTEHLPTPGPSVVVPGLYSAPTNNTPGPSVVVPGPYSAPTNNTPVSTNAMGQISVLQPPPFGLDLNLMLPTSHWNSIRKQIDSSTRGDIHPFLKHVANFPERLPGGQIKEPQFSARARDQHSAQIAKFSARNKKQWGHVQLPAIDEDSFTGPEVHVQQEESFEVNDKQVLEEEYMAAMKAFARAGEPQGVFSAAKVQRKKGFELNGKQVTEEEYSAASAGAEEQIQQEKLSAIEDEFLKEAGEEEEFSVAIEEAFAGIGEPIED